MAKTKMTPEIIKQHDAIAQKAVIQAIKGCWRAIGEVKRQSHLHDNLGLDSLDVLEAAMEVEEDLDITFEDTEIDAFRTVHDMVIRAIEKLVEKLAKKN